MELFLILILTFSFKCLGVDNVLFTFMLLHSQSLESINHKLVSCLFEVFIYIRELQILHRNFVINFKFRVFLIYLF